MPRRLSSVLITIGFAALVALALLPSPLTVIVHTGTTTTSIDNSETTHETTHNHNHASPAAAPAGPASGEPDGDGSERGAR